MKDIIQS